MSYPPFIDKAVRDAQNGERISLADGCTGTVAGHRLCHLNVDAAVYRKVIWITGQPQKNPEQWLDPHVENTLEESWYRTHVAINFCQAAVDIYEV